MVNFKFCAEGRSKWMEIKRKVSVAELSPVAKREISEHTHSVLKSCIGLGGFLVYLACLCPGGS